MKLLGKTLAFLGTALAASLAFNALMFAWAKVMMP